MQAYQRPPANSVGQKNYVFVDEHNRHKRLKVMRACEGCRRRKIKCDAATTNSWPCAACTRLKLHCIPPTSGNELDIATTGQYLGSHGFNEYAISSTQASNLVQDPGNLNQYTALPFLRGIRPAGEYDQSAANDRSQTHAFASAGQEIYQDVNHTSVPPSATAAHISHSFYAPQPSQIRSKTRSTSESGRSTAEDLSQALGDLKIDENGIAHYARRQKKHEPEPEGPIQDAELRLPPLSTGAGSQIRIPPALMPLEEDALHYFQIFFADIHPYVPVINRSHFYRQWHTSRSSISPLLLEAIFACAGRMSDDPGQGAPWLALANRHEECFLDTPRLSTLQALLVLLKARESAPKRGYYYRSWMTCKTIVSMAKDLDLHEHLEVHNEGQPCGSDPVECLTKTRIWQTTLVCEMMVGAPQGRSDMGVDPKSVDAGPNPPGSEMNDFEGALSRQFSYFVRNARNIRIMVDASNRLKKMKDWGLDPEFLGNNVAFTRWPDDLPEDLQISFPCDGSPPWLPSHFVGNMHSHYHLGIIMLQRPQLLASKSFPIDGAWKHHMSVCYNSAKALCRLQEAILETFDLPGLLCMQRGINFTIYAILTCTMLHLVAITSPDPLFNSDALDYFTRHMRILERCTTAWPMPEMEAQINALRVAFSADINKPFQLKSSFPYCNPSSESFQPSPPLEAQYQQLQIPYNTFYVQQRHPSYASQTITPPISAGAGDMRTHSPQMHQSLGIMSTSHQQVIPSRQQQHQPPEVVDNTSWNPTPIIDQWHTAFSIPPSALGPPSSHSSSPSVGLPVPQTTQTVPPTHANRYASQYSATSANTSAPRAQQIPQQQSNYMSSEPIFVTPTEWQQSVARVYDPAGLKRRWDYDMTDLDPGSHRRVR